MNGFIVLLARSARKELEDLNEDLQDRILAAIDRLSENPWPPGCKKLKGESNAYRIRVGHYRVVFEVSDKTVLIGRIRHRKDVYKC